MDIFVGMILEQKKLDVEVKSRSNLFNWRGQFTPEFVEYILASFSNSGDYICDPFSGSGTVLQESARLGHKVIGFEINPSAFAMSNFFVFCNFSIEERISFYSVFESKLKIFLDQLNGQKIYVQSNDYRQSYFNLLNFGITFDKVLVSMHERIFFLNILFQSEKDKKMTLKESIHKSLNYIKSCLFNLPISTNIVEARLLDARETGEVLNNEIDLILTSPPYINVFNYHQNYRAIIESFNFDILKVAHSEFGSNRKNRGNRFKTVVQYCIDMEIAISAFHKSLKNGAKMILVVGRESNVRSTPFYNSKMVIEIIENLNGFEDIKILERKFMNKFGDNIMEDIIIATKKSITLGDKKARNIAFSHLTKALNDCSGSVSSDIEDAILNINNIEASPMFNSKNIINERI